MKFVFRQALSLTFTFLLFKTLNILINIDDAFWISAVFSWRCRQQLEVDGGPFSAVLLTVSSMDHILSDVSSKGSPRGSNKVLQGTRRS